MPTRALLLSGGIDSTALAAWQMPEFCITIDYGQKPAKAELKAAAAICLELGLKHLVIQIDCSTLGSGDLAGTPASSLAPASEWWPYRNQLLVTLAAMKAINYGVKDIMVGSVKTDSIHKDGTAEFYSELYKLLSLQEGGLQVTAPALHLSSPDLVRISGMDLKLLSLAYSCHTGNLPCGRCRGCTKHREVMAELGCDVY